MAVPNEPETTASAPAVGVRSLELDGDVSLFHPETDHALVLNRTASDVWRLLDGARDAEQIVALLAAVYGTERAAIHDDVLRVIADLTEYGFLVAGAAHAVDTAGSAAAVARRAPDRG